MSSLPSSGQISSWARKILEKEFKKVFFAGAVNEKRPTPK